MFNIYEQRRATFSMLTDDLTILSLYCTEKNINLAQLINSVEFLESAKIFTSLLVLICFQED